MSLQSPLLHIKVHRLEKLLVQKDEIIKQLENKLENDSIAQITKVDTKVDTKDSLNYNENNFTNLNSKLDKLIKLIEKSNSENIKLEIN